MATSGQAPPPSRPRPTSISPRRRTTHVFVSTPEEYDDTHSFGGRGESNSQRSRLSWLGSWSSVLGKQESHQTVLGEEVFVDPIGEGSDEEQEEAIGSVRSGRSTPSYIGGSDHVPVEEDGELVNEQTALLPKSPVTYHTPSSTAIQTTLNSINLLMGMGILSFPFALSLTGWIVGITLVLLFALIASTTAKLLAKCMDVTPIDLPTTTSNLPPRPKSMSYGDVGQAAFGRRAKNFIAIVYLAELYAASTALLILAADSIHALFPHWKLLHIKLGVVALLILTTWPRSVRGLSYASLVGVVAILNLLTIVVVDGVTKADPPGSLLQPAETRLWPKSFDRVALAVGIMFVGYDGHAVFPNIYRDMKSPVRFARCINVTYLVVSAFYIAIAACGYLMFGNDVLPEITLNLASIPSYNPVLNKLTLWLIAINPVTKYALAVRPVHMAIENTLHLSPPFHLLARTVLSILILLTSLLFPQFHRLMGLLGSAFSGTVAIVFPLLCYWKLFGGSLGVLGRAVLGMGVGVGVLVIVVGVWGVVGARV
ncbi:uncharacterized protein SPPG_09433 [Spizellomyces punctatus DAOM BR117]|uniref:Amino acid transporter transmembrane domain-containing protein n=1 Tax=Spizellomyces punctatus (strain DAOM BR117) TaxID=645134 RepID=A0A0L0H8M3_SPIPD|nr:uncharacterized protein SPPG_09433 [Spizellomyces punctatus DAOM BR117]KNC97552.1 hypothetical protein SPPG_09433 [Spizellomyces punctatus DAOM BR117]|eukprot:XP_016605592.1 hypothetical protein SPPG_09433 [Spizellomyces punctatus DAOM BR117]